MDRLNTPTTRVSVLEGIKNDCGSAWRTFFEIYAPIVYRYARHARLSEFDADEVVANVMRNFVRALPTFTHDPLKGRFRYYLKKAANREIVAQRHRGRRRAASLEDVPEVSEPEALPDAGWAEWEREERLRTCLNRLRTAPAIRPRDLLAFERYALHGEPAEQVAKELGISRSRLYVIKHEIIQQLRKVRAQLDEVLGEV